MNNFFTRRKLITAGFSVAAGASGVGAAAYLASRYGLIPPDHSGILGIGETLTYSTQRLLMSKHSLAREFERSDISKIAPVNGPHPTDENYRKLLANGFRNWRLPIEGLVRRPVSLSLEDLQRLPSESRIILHACEEGWSYIAEWTGVRLASVLDLVETRPEARYVVFEPFPNPRQTTGVVRVLGCSIDMADALHPQTLLAYGMNGEALPAGSAAHRFAFASGDTSAHQEHQVSFPDGSSRTRLILEAAVRGTGGWPFRGSDGLPSSTALCDRRASFPVNPYQRGRQRERRARACLAERLASGNLLFAVCVEYPET